MTELTNFIIFLQSDTGLWIFWAAITGSLCSLAYSVGKELAFRKYCKLSGRKDLLKK